MDDDNGKLDENLTFFLFPPMKLFFLPLPWTTTGKMEKKVKYDRHHSYSHTKLDMVWLAELA